MDGYLGIVKQIFPIGNVCFFMLLVLKLKNDESNPSDVAFGKLTLMLTWSTPLRVTFVIPFPVKVIDWDL